MKLRRRQLILTSLVLALGAAVYLNWQFSDNNGLIATEMLQPQKELGETRYVNNSKMSYEPEENDSCKETIANMSSETKEYFAKARLERQKSRDEASETIKKTFTDNLVPDEVKNEAAKQIEEIAKSIQDEVNIENLIKAKGFSECLVFIRNGQCSVIVNPGTLNDSSVITIRDIVSGQSNIPFDKIKIAEAK